MSRGDGYTRHFSGSCQTRPLDMRISCGTGAPMRTREQWMSATVQSEQTKPVRKRRVQGDGWASKTFFTVLAGVVVLVIVAIIVFVASRAFLTFTHYHISPLDF